MLLFTTGDIGEWQPDGSMKIIDRKKNIFKLSQGEYVAVENLENIFGQTPGVDSVQLKTTFIHNTYLSFLQQIISKHPKICPLISYWYLQVWVYGNSFESSLVAVVNPNKQALERWAESNGVTGEFATICEDPKAKEFILGELTKMGKEKKVRNLDNWNTSSPMWNAAGCNDIGSLI